MNHGVDAASIGLHLTVNGGLRAIEFYRSAFGAVPTVQHVIDDGRVMHASIDVFGGQVMLSDHFPDHSSDVVPPDLLGGSSVTVQVSFPAAQDVDKAMDRAATFGARVSMAPWNAFWGMRYGRIVDPFGHSWAFSAPCDIADTGLPIGTHVSADGPPALPATLA